MCDLQHINKSLSALGDVIAALKQKSAHVPFRNSKLTYLLQECLGGSSKCLMFAQISPSSDNYSESACSLRFALRVRNVQLGEAKRQTSKAEAVEKLKAQLQTTQSEAKARTEQTEALRRKLMAAEEHGSGKDELIAKLQKELKQKEKEVRFFVCFIRL